ncbi:MAG: hypothetical protein AAFP92_30500, partial [Bacteroidota bacterium]
STTRKYVTPEGYDQRENPIRGLHDRTKIAESSDDRHVGVLDPDSSPPYSRKNFRGDKIMEEK